MNRALASTLTAGQLMHTELVLVEPWDTLGETADKMAALDRGSALVATRGSSSGSFDVSANSWRGFF